MKFPAFILSAFLLLCFASPAWAAGWDHRHGDVYERTDPANWYAGHWWFGMHQNRGGWWWITPGNGWYLYSEPVYPYPVAPFPVPPPVVMTSPVVEPPYIAAY